METISYGAGLTAKNDFLGVGAAEESIGVFAVDAEIIGADNFSARSVGFAGCSVSFGDGASFFALEPAIIFNSVDIADIESAGDGNSIGFGDEIVFLTDVNSVFCSETAGGDTVRGSVKRVGELVAFKGEVALGDSGETAGADFVIGGISSVGFGAVFSAVVAFEFVGESEARATGS